MPFSPKDVLRELLGDSPNHYQKVACGRRLARSVNKKVSFTEGYIDNVLSGRQTLTPRGKLYKALFAEWQRAQGMVQQIHPLTNEMNNVNIRAVKGIVEPGTIIRRGSKRCDYCDQPFLPLTWNQRFCCPICRGLSRKHVGARP